MIEWVTRGLFGKLGWGAGERNRHGVKQCPDLAAVPAIGRLRNGALCRRNQPLLRPLRVASYGRRPGRRGLGEARYKATEEAMALDGSREQRRTQKCCLALEQLM
jgi:hypothetical protein